MDEFRYEALISPSSSFRILKLHPGQVYAPIRCSLITAYLPDSDRDHAPIAAETIEEYLTDGQEGVIDRAAVSNWKYRVGAEDGIDNQGHIGYEATSYTWGEPKDISTIICHERSLVVPSNLVDALMQLRGEEAVFLLWADAVCIDQSNLDERAAQVRIMSTIFRQAKHVLIWLGDKNTTVNVPPVATHGLSASLRRLFRDSAYYPALLNNMPASLQRTIHDSLNSTAFTAVETLAVLSVSMPSEVKRPPPNFDFDRDRRWKEVFRIVADDEKSMALKQLYLKPWFSRVWVVQEAGLARKAYVYWGTARTAWCNIVATAQLLCHMQYSPVLRRRIDSVLLNLPGLRHATYINSFAAVHEEERVISTLHNVRSFHARDARDRVYAQYEQLHGHAMRYEDDEKFCPVFQLAYPDYKKPIEVLFTEIASYLIDVEGPRALAYIEHPAPDNDGVGDTLEDASGTQRFPSWVPRWDQPQMCPAFPNISDYLDPLTGNIAPAMNHKPKHVRFATDENLWTLGLEGSRQDIVAATATVAEAFALQRTAMERITASLNASYINGTQLDTDKYLAGRKALWTGSGLARLGPSLARPGDIICVFTGCNREFVLRQRIDGTYLFVGQCFFDGAIKQYEHRERLKAKSVPFVIR